MYRFRLTCTLLLVAVCSLPAQAQVLTWKKGQRDIRESLPQELKQPRAWEVPVKLVLTPAAEPSPALKYRCWIPLEQRQSGDVESSVLRAVILYLKNPLRSELDRQYIEIVQALPDTTSGDVIPTEALRSDVRDYLNSHADVLKHLHYALRLDTIVSNVAGRDKRGLDALDTNVSVPQTLRSLAWLLQLECRLAIVEGRFEDALDALQSGYRLAEVTLRSDGETLLTQLVSLALTGMMTNEVQTLLQRPDAPNLYWALASVPLQELVSTRTVMEGEFLTITRSLMPWTLDDIEVESESQAEGRLIDLLSNIRSYVDVPGEDTAHIVAQDRVIAAVAVGVFADRARLEIGDTEAGNCQALLLWTTSDFKATMETVFKWSYLPLDLRLARKDLIDDSISRLRGFPDSPAGALMMTVLPMVQALDSAVARTQRHHALLITLEALRAYAAENSGALPETLDKLTPLPAWPDTTTGKAFEYQRNDPHHAVIHIEKSIGVPSEYHIEMRQ